jgi:hypothetical protein
VLHISLCVLLIAAFFLLADRNVKVCAVFFALAFVVVGLE